MLYEQLGSGAFGTVYRGLWNSQPVAVKVLQTSCPSSSRELKSFRQEIAVLSRLRHPNIISFYAACTVPPDICIVEELAEGGSLHEKLHGKPGERRRMPLPYDQLLKVAIDVAEAMRYLHYEHAPKIVHRDLKSQVSKGSIHLNMLYFVSIFIFLSKCFKENLCLCSYWFSY